MLTKLSDRTADTAVVWPSLIFLGGSLCALLLVWWPNYLPMVDAPNHLARLHIITSPAASPLRKMYAVHWALIPNLGLDLGYMALRGFVSPETLIRLCVSLSFTLILAAVWYTNRTLFGRTLYSVAATPIFLFGTVWHMGYINFLMGTSVALVALAVYLRSGRQMTPLRTTVLALLGVVMLICHVFAFAGFALVLSALHLSDELSEHRLLPLATSLRKFVHIALVCAPASIIYILCERPAHTTGIEYGIKKLRIIASAILGTEGPIDIAILAGVLVLLLIALKAGVLRVSRVARPALILLAVTILVLPVSIDNAVDVDSRLVILLVLVFLSVTEVRPETCRLGSVTAVTCLCILLVLRMASVLEQESFYNRTVAQFQAAVALIERDKAVLVGADTHTKPDCGISTKDLSWPDLFTHLTSFATIDRDAFVPLTFTGRGMQPIRLTHAYAKLGAPASVPVPIELLRIATDSRMRDRLAAVLIAHSQPTYFLNWWSTFDYVMVLHNGCARNPLPTMLKPIAAGDLFGLYSIRKPLLLEESQMQ